MKIINPLYDTAFKYLMENNRIARKVLSVFLDTEIKDLVLMPQEKTYFDESRKLSLFRVDFKAIILDKNGEKKTVLVELQKSKNDTDIQRFRNYLGTNYSEKTMAVMEDNTDQEQYSLPIITIYILGYELSDLPYLAVKVNRNIINLANQQSIKANSYFVNHLTHESIIIQIRRLSEKRATRLEKFMSFFDQEIIAEEKYFLNMDNVPEEFKEIAKHLDAKNLDKGFRQQLALEDEIEQKFNTIEKRLSEEIRLKKEEQKLKEEERRQKEEERRQKEEERRQKEEERRQKEELKEQLKKALELGILALHKSGKSNQEIAYTFGISVEEVVNILP